MSLSSKSISSNFDTFIQNQFHPKTFRNKGVEIKTVLKAYGPGGRGPGIIRGRSWVGGPGRYGAGVAGPGLGVLGWGSWVGGPGLGVLGWGSWVGCPGLGVLGWVSWVGGSWAGGPGLGVWGWGSGVGSPFTGGLGGGQNFALIFSSPDHLLCFFFL